MTERLKFTQVSRVICPKTGIHYLDAIDEKINEVKASYPKNMKPITREKYNAMIEEIANNVLD